MAPSPRERLIVALDLPSVGAAEAMVDRLGETAEDLRPFVAADFAKSLVGLEG